MDYIFCGEIIETKILHGVFKAMNFKEYAVVRIMGEGFKVTVEDMRTIQTSAYIPNDVFSKYIINLDSDEPLKFKISLKHFTEILNIFGDDGNHTLKIMYKALGSPLALLITHGEENIVVDCEMVTMDTDDMPEIIIPESETINNVIIQATPFMNILSELDSSSDIVEVLTSPNPPFFQISTIGTMGDSQVEIAKYSDIIENFGCSTELSSQYLYSNVKLLLKIIGLANKISISTSPDGILGIQVIVTCENESKIYVEYFIKAMLEE